MKAQCIAPKITEQSLRQAKPENLVRLARSLNLEPLGMSHASLARLVWLTLGADQYVGRFNSPEKKEDYQRLWENL